MEHPDIELLTQFVLDDPLALDAATLVHISDCAQCTHEIEQLQRVVDATLVVGGRPDLRTLTPPPPDVWERITAELDGVAMTDAVESAAANAAGPRHTTRAESATARHRDPNIPVAKSQERRRWRGWQIAAAAVVGIVAGAGITWAVVDQSDSVNDDTPVAASSTLDGFDGHDASGTAELAERETGPELTVDFDPGTAAADNGFLQVWLLDADTGGMVALGVLDGDTGTFSVPSKLDLATYNQIDVSLEPFDGDPAHSAVSLARGPVP